MEIDLKNNEKAFIRPYEEKDFSKIQDLNKREGWSNLVENHLSTKEAWKNSNVTLIIEIQGQGIVGYLRGLTDTRVSLFICELLIDKQYRSLGLGKRIIHYLHNIYPNVRIELLATSSSRLFYEGIGFRTFYGYRKTKEE